MHAIQGLQDLRPDILTHSGRHFDFLVPERDAIQIEDIAHALAHTCRFGGHCRQFYSVAQHCYHASMIVPPADALAALLHDAAEAYLGDVPKPLKQLLPDYQALEARLEVLLFDQLGIAQPLPDSVSVADRVMLATEQRDLMAADKDVWVLTAGVAPLAQRIVPLPSGAAKHAFLDRYYELVPEADPDRGRYALLEAELQVAA